MVPYIVWRVDRVAAMTCILACVVASVYRCAVVECVRVAVWRVSRRHYGVYRVVAIACVAAAYGVHRGVYRGRRDICNNGAAIYAITVPRYMPKRRHYVGNRGVTISSNNAAIYAIPEARHTQQRRNDICNNGATIYVEFL